jgi:hypothetical protein
LLTDWQSIATAFNDGTVSVTAKARTLAENAFSFSIPLVQSSFSRAVDAPGKLQSPFGLKLDPNETNLQKLKDYLHDQLGFTVERLDVNPDPTTHDLVRLSKDFTFSATQANFLVGGIGGSLGFSYFDDQVAGGLDVGTLRADVQAVTFHLTFGVDLVGTQPTLFLQDSMADAQGHLTRLDLPGITGQTRLHGLMNIKNLLNVDIRGDAVLNLGANLLLQSPNSDHKLHVTDDPRTNELTAGHVSGKLTGSASFTNVILTAQVSVLPPPKLGGQLRPRLHEQ